MGIQKVINGSTFEIEQLNKEQLNELKEGVKLCIETHDDPGEDERFYYSFAEVDSFTKVRCLKRLKLKIADWYDLRNFRYFSLTLNKSVKDSGEQVSYPSGTKIITRYYTYKLIS